MILSMCSAAMATAIARRRAAVLARPGSLASALASKRGDSSVRATASASTVQSRRSKSTSTEATPSRLFTWGSGAEGELGHGAFEKNAITGSYYELSPREVKLDGLNFVDISCGLSYTAAITDDGKLYTWGEGKNHKLGHGDTKNVNQPKPVEALQDVKIVQVACGEMHTAAVDSEGNLYTWGSGGSFWGGVGGLGHGDDSEQPKPKLVQSLVSYGAKVGSVACGERHTIILTDDGEVLTVGNGEYGRLGNGGSSDLLEPQPLDFFEPTVTIVKAVAGHAFNLVLTADGKVWGWGRNEQGQLGLGGGISMDLYCMEAMPMLIEALEGKKVVAIGAGHSHSAAVTDQGELYMWGMKNYLEPQLLKLSVEGQEVPPKATGLQCGGYFTACVTEDGRLFTCGKGSSLALGHGNKSYTPHPVLVDSLRDRKIRRLACGQKHMAVLTD